MTNEAIASSPRQPKRSTMGRLAVILVVSLPLIGIIFVCQSRNSALTDEFNALRRETDAVVEQLAETNEQRRKLDQSAEVYRFQKNRISSVLKSCRQIEDFWENDSLMCVATNTESPVAAHSLRLLLPSGKHELVFRMKKIERKCKKELLNKELRYPLTAGSYFIELDMPKEKDASYRDPRELFLRITSSNADFSLITEKLLDHRIPRRSGGSGSLSPTVTFFPNQFRRSNNTADKGVLVNRMKWRFGTGKQPAFDLNFEMRLESDSPKVVSSLDKNSSFTTKHQLKYLGDGRYEILPPPKD